MGGPLVIPGGPDAHNNAIREGFAIGDEHTVYEWAMIYTDRHPQPWETDGETTEDMLHREAYLGARAIDSADDVRKIAGAVYRELIEEVAAGRILPRKRAYCGDRPDPTRFVLGVSDVLALARRRKDGGEYVSKLLEQDAAARPAAGRTSTTGHTPPAREAAARALRSERKREMYERWRELADRYRLHEDGRPRTRHQIVAKIAKDTMAADRDGRAPEPSTVLRRLNNDFPGWFIKKVGQENSA